MPACLQTLGEEVANSVSHGIGFLAAVAVTPFLVVAAIPHGAGSIVGVSIFAVTMAALYLASTLYHALPSGRAKRVFGYSITGRSSFSSPGPTRRSRLGFCGGAGDGRCSALYGPWRWPA